MSKGREGEDDPRVSVMLDELAMADDNARHGAHPPDKGRARDALRRIDAAGDDLNTTEMAILLRRWLSAAENGDAPTKEIMEETRAALHGAGAVEIYRVMEVDYDGTCALAHFSHRPEAETYLEELVSQLGPEEDRSELRLSVVTLDRPREDLRGAYEVCINSEGAVVASVFTISLRPSLSWDHSPVDGAHWWTKGGEVQETESLGAIRGVGRTEEEALGRARKLLALGPPSPGKATLD